ncbi:MAG: sulfur-oxidizing protein SoxY [Candidatus Azotimanducaceae bacterium]|jgi:sulfur-oxidizing protein SoxY
MSGVNLKRRVLLIAGVSGWLLQCLPVRLNAQESSLIRSFYGDQDIQPSGVLLKTPSLAENGNSVSLEVEAESPMTTIDYVKEIRLFAPQNPDPELAVFRFGPGAGLARVSTRVRFANSQTITAVATMSDGRLFSGSSKTIITLAACVEPLL